MRNTLSDVEEIKFHLNDCEKRIMLLLGKNEISQNKNIWKETIKKKLPDKYNKEIDKALKSLIIKKKLIRRYRKDNYALNPLGLKVAHSLKREFLKDRYNDLNKILFVIRWFLKSLMPKEVN